MHRFGPRAGFISRGVRNSGHRRRVDGRIARSRRKGGAGAPQRTCIYQTQRGAEPHAQLRHRPRRWQVRHVSRRRRLPRTECPRPPGGNHGVRRARHAVLRNSWNRRKRQRRPTLERRDFRRKPAPTCSAESISANATPVPADGIRLPLLAGDARRQLAADGSDLARGRRVHTPRVVLRTADPISSPSGFTTTCNAAIRSWAITSRKVA